MRSGYASIPVFTQGQAGDATHLGQLGDIPLVGTTEVAKLPITGRDNWCFTHYFNSIAMR